MSETNTDPAAERSSSPRRWLRRLLLTSVALFGALLATLVFLATTETGLRVVQSAMQRLAPGVVEIARVEGSLFAQPTLHGLRIRLPAAELFASRITLQWSPARLLDRELRIEALEADDLQVLLVQGDTASGPLYPLPSVNLPLSVVLERMRVNSLAVTPAGSTEPKIVRGIELVARWKGEELRLEKAIAAMDEPAIKGEVDGSLVMGDAWPIDLAVQWHLAVDGREPLVGSGRVSGNLAQELTLVHESSGLAESRISARVMNPLADLNWQAEISAVGLEPRKFDASLPDSSLDLSLRGNGTLDDLTLDGTLDARLADLAAPGRVHGETSIKVVDDLLEVSALRLSTPPGAGVLTATGSYRIGGPQAGTIDGTVSWDALGWPIDGPPQWQSPTGRLRLSGTMDAFHHELETRVEGSGIPPAELKWKGRGTPSELRFEELVATLLDGRVEAEGVLAFSSDPEWRFDLSAAGLNPVALVPDMEGDLGAEVTTSGRFSEKFEATIELKSLEGTLLERPVAGKGVFRWRDALLRIDSLALSAGDNQVSVSGSVGDVLDLATTVDAPDLSQLLPNASGAIRGDARIAGKPVRPDVEADVVVKNFRLDDVRVENLDAKARVSASAAGVLELDLKGAGIRAGAADWHSLSLKATGTTSDHRFSAVMQGAPVSVQVTGLGRWEDDGLYDGALDTLKFGSSEAGDWRLLEPADFMLGSASWKLGQACLASTTQLGRLCLAADGEGDQWRAKADFESLMLKAFQPLLPEGMALEGEIKGGAEFTVSGNQLNGSALLGVVSGRTSVDLGENDQELVFTNSKLEVSAAAGDLNVNLELPFEGLGRLDGELRLTDWRMDAPVRPTQPLVASLKGGISDLSPLVTLVPVLSDLEGSLDVDLAASGTLESAVPSGQIRLAKVGFQVPDLNIRVSELSFAGRSRSLDLLEYEGRGKIGDGLIQLEGDTRAIGGAGMTTRLSVRGDRLIVADIPEAKVRVSPDLELTVDRERAELTGTIVVPEALIKPRAIPQGSVSPSSDVVVSGEGDEEADLRLATAADIRIKLGESVRFDGFGLRGLIRGDLRVTQEPGRLALGNGQLSIEDGIFTAFGEELPIEQGRLIFANTPVEDPGLNVVARREFSEGTVGARVVGTLKNPQLTFFSDPPMGQAEALNMLLTGGASRGGGSDAATMVGGSFLLRKAGSKIGLNDIGVTRTEGSENMSVFVGTYLNPKLYMQYITEMGNRANRVRFRYDLTKRLQAEVETGMCSRARCTTPLSAESPPAAS